MGKLRDQKKERDAVAVRDLRSQPAPQTMSHFRTEMSADVFVFSHDDLKFITFKTDAKEEYERDPTLCWIAREELTEKFDDIPFDIMSDDHYTIAIPASAVNMITKFLDTLGVDEIQVTDPYVKDFANGGGTHAVVAPVRDGWVVAFYFCED